MAIFRLALVAAAALGVTWAAEVAVRQAALPDGQLILAQAPAEPAGSEEGEAQAAEAADEASATGEAFEDLSEEEMERELARIEAAVQGQDSDDLEEFEPSKPLVADTAIDLPSDI